MNKILVTLSFLISLICISSQSWGVVWCQYTYSNYTEWAFPFWEKDYCISNTKKISEISFANKIKNFPTFKRKLCFLLDGQITSNLKPYYDLKIKYNIDCD